MNNKLTNTHPLTSLAAAAGKKSDNGERMGQVGSSHLNETFSIEWDATVFGGQMKPTVADDKAAKKVVLTHRFMVSSVVCK